VDSVVNITKINDVYSEVDSNEIFILKELVEYFTFKVPGCEFMPSYRNKMWDGRIRLLNPNTRKLYTGLISFVQNFCERNEYTCNLVGFDKDKDITDKELLELTKIIDPHSLGKKIDYRDYQLEAVKHAINKERCLLISPTASGKSLIIYTLIRFYLMHPELKDRKMLIIVPTTSLVSQMFSDFKDYGFDSDKYCHKIYSGEDKSTDKKIVISTWQSIYKMGPKYFEQFGAVFGDECHLFKANSLTKIMEKMTNCKFRVGTTGTLDGTKTHKLVLSGLFGDVKQVTTTKKLIDTKTLADFKIQCCVLKYTPEMCKDNKGKKYKEEIDWILANEERNRFITNLVISRNGNTLLLYNYVESHGKPLYNAILKKLEDTGQSNRPVFFVSGEIKADERERIREITEKSTNAIIVASYGTFSTGVNIRHLHTVIFASPSKSRIRNLQSIGRGLRKGANKESAILIDIADDLKHKTYINFALRHFYERINIYNEEKFDFQVYDIELYKGFK
jgi:superfamily II DNA or RNA helicase